MENEEIEDAEEFDDLGMLHRAELTDDMRKVLGEKERKPFESAPRSLSGWHDLPDEVLG